MKLRLVLRIYAGVFLGLGFIFLLIARGSSQSTFLNTALWSAFSFLNFLVYLLGDVPQSQSDVAAFRLFLHPVFRLTISVVSGVIALLYGFRSCVT